MYTQVSHYRLMALQLQTTNKSCFIKTRLDLFVTPVSICDRLCENRPSSHLAVIRETLV